MIFIIVTIICLDQFTKVLAVRYLKLLSSSPVIANVFHLTLIHNRGGAFGVLRNQVPIFIFTSLLAIVLIVLNLRAARRSKSYSISLSLILAGAVGNLIDRISYGYVIDFLDFRIWPVFNIADSAITIGAVLLGWAILFKDKKKTTR